MWIFRWVFVAVILFILLVFSMQNPKETAVNIFGWSTPPIPIYLIVFFAFAAGFVVFLLVAIYQQLQHSNQLRRCKKRIKQLESEMAEKEIQEPPAESSRQSDDAAGEEITENK